jgi:hypothetical protein
MNLQHLIEWILVTTRYIPHDWILSLNNDIELLFIAPTPISIGHPPAKRIIDMSIDPSSLTHNVNTPSKPIENC